MSRIARLRCALAALPAENGDADRLLRSFEAARQVGLGDFAELIWLPAASTEPRDALRAAAEAAQAGGFDWLFAVSEAETLVPDIFVKLAPALRLHDAIWGAARLVTSAGAPRKPEPVTRLAAEDVPSFFHAALVWWIGRSHFVRPPRALAALHADATPAWYADYMMHLWQAGGAYKTAQAITAFHDRLPPVGAADRERLIAALEDRPIYMPVSFGAFSLRLPYTGLNPIIERDQTRGQFFEHAELRFLAERLPRGLRIVDAGANTGNHTIFFAAVLAAKSVMPIEPHPRAAAAIRDAVRENSLDNVDLSCLGVALGSKAGRAGAVISAGGGLGATRFVADPAGAIQVAPLDLLIAGPVDFLKIDVEGMEMAVLTGAAGLIARCRPVIFIEVLDETIAEFLAWADAGDYRIEKLFPDKTHCNYLLVPAAR